MCDNFDFNLRITKKNPMSVVTMSRETKRAHPRLRPEKLRKEESRI